MRKSLAIVLTILIGGLIGGKLLMWYGVGHNGSFFICGLLLYILFFFGIFLLALLSEEY